MVKINRLEVENLKRIKSCVVEPTANGLTVIGGKNGQGKTSALDAIAWALGGDKNRPSSPTRQGSVLPPSIKVTLSNGLIVERSGKNSALKVTDPEGRHSGQQLLNEFVGQLALNLPRFMTASNKDKAQTLLGIIGIGEQLASMERMEAQLYNERLLVGREADRKKKHAESLPHYDGLPDNPVSVSELIQAQQAILARNGENQRKREARARYDRELAEAQLAYDAAAKRLREAEKNAMIARKSAEDLADESTAELERNIAEADAINVKIRANLIRDAAEDEANRYSAEYDDLSAKIDKVRRDKMRLLEDAPLPLPGLSVEDGELTYNGAKWDCMRGAEQLMVSTAIVRALNPECGFVLIDKLEQMDIDTMQEFGAWLEAEGLQVIATRVSTGGECSLIIEDGYVRDSDPPRRPWEGVF